jgi:hypothetical protein
MAVHQASATFVANGAMVAFASVISPTKESVVDLTTAKTVPTTALPPVVPENQIRA